MCLSSFVFLTLKSRNRCFLYCLSVARRLSFCSVVSARARRPRKARIRLLEVGICISIRGNFFLGAKTLNRCYIWRTIVYIISTKSKISIYTKSESFHIIVNLTGTTKIGGRWVGSAISPQYRILVNKFEENWTISDEILESEIMKKRDKTRKLKADQRRLIFERQEKITIFLSKLPRKNATK